MYAEDTLPAQAAAGPTPPARDALLEIDAREFGECFDRRPFMVKHHLADHARFSLPRLVQLSRFLAAENVEYNAGDIPVSMDPALTPRNGLTPEETICRIAECRSWLVLKRVEQHPDYRALLETCLEEVRPHSERLRPGMRDAQAFIFVSSPGSITPYHMDPEHNFLLQIRGSKEVRLFERSVVGEEELERFHTAGGHRNLAFREEYHARSLACELIPGRGLHFPVHAPHYVRNGPDVSISFSITFRTPDLERLVRTHQFNAWLRRRGVPPAPVGQHPGRDRLKSLALRVARKLSRFG